MIRTYRPVDCDDLLEVWAKASVQAHPFLTEEFLELERYRVRNVYLEKAETWVFESDGRVVGFISLLGNEVGGIFVDPQWQRAGIGSELMDHARTLRGELEVEVFRQNLPGRAFYAKYGFEPIRHLIHEETGLDLIRLMLAADKRLPPV